MAPRDAQAGAVRSPAGTGARGDSFYRFFRCSHIFAAAVHEILETQLLQEASHTNLTLPQLRLLRLMTLNGQRQLGEVADVLGVTPPAATKNIDKLERLGLVVRSASAGDRRATLLSVSAKGRRLVRKYDEMKTAHVGAVLARFEHSELALFTELLERFAVSLLGLLPQNDRFCLRCIAHFEEGCPVDGVRGGCSYRWLAGAIPRGGASDTGSRARHGRALGSEP